MPTFYRLFVFFIFRIDAGYNREIQLERMNAVLLVRWNRRQPQLEADS
jgi:hypothetical protein